MAGFTVSVFGIIPNGCRSVIHFSEFVSFSVLPLTVKNIADTIVLTIHLFHGANINGNYGKEFYKMTLTQKRLLILTVIMIIAVVSGRLAVRAVLNFLLGGTMFGGNFL